MAPTIRPFVRLKPDLHISGLWLPLLRPRKKHGSERVAVFGFTEDTYQSSFFHEPEGVFVLVQNLLNVSRH